MHYLQYIIKNGFKWNKLIILFIINSIGSCLQSYLSIYWVVNQATATMTYSKNTASIKPNAYALPPVPLPPTASVANGSISTSTSTTFLTPWFPYLFCPLWKAGPTTFSKISTPTAQTKAPSTMPILGSSPFSCCLSWLAAFFVSICL